MKAEKAPVERLLKTARGQLDSVLRMVEEDRYCIDICNQLLAVQSLLKKVNRLVLQGHLEGCVQEACSAGNGDEKVQEVLALLDRIVEQSTK